MPRRSCRKLSGNVITELNPWALDLDDKKGSEEEALSSSGMMFDKMLRHGRRTHAWK